MSGESIEGSPPSPATESGSSAGSSPLASSSGQSKRVSIVRGCLASLMSPEEDETMHENSVHSTRESWLNAATALLTERFKSEGLAPLGSVRVGVGFTGMGKRSKRIGETWAAEASTDNTFEIIIAPTLDATRDVLGTLAHELVHASLPAGSKHGPAFKRVATAIGLEGKMTATSVGPMLGDILDWMAEDLGPYPHARLTVELSGRKTAATRLLKVACEPCEYVGRFSRAALDLGMPLCGVCHEPMSEA